MRIHETWKDIIFHQTSGFPKKLDQTWLAYLWHLRKL